MGSSQGSAVTAYTYGGISYTALSLHVGYAAAGWAGILGGCIALGVFPGGFGYFNKCKEFIKIKNEGNGGENVDDKFSVDVGGVSANKLHGGQNPAQLGFENNTTNELLRQLISQQ